MTQDPPTLPGPTPDPTTSPTPPSAPAPLAQDPLPDATDPTDATRAGRVDTARSRALAEIVGARSKECWRNAILALSLPGADLATAEYVEGWVIGILGVPFEHGWLETVDGRVLEPTLVLIESDAELAQARYVAARRWARHTALFLATRDGTTLPLLADEGYRYYQTPEWRGAHDRMMGIVFGPLWAAAQARQRAEDELTRAAAGSAATEPGD